MPATATGGVGAQAGKRSDRTGPTGSEGRIGPAAAAVGRRTLGRRSACSGRCRYLLDSS